MNKKRAIVITLIAFFFLVLVGMGILLTIANKATQSGPVNSPVSLPVASPVSFPVSSVVVNPAPVVPPVAATPPTPAPAAVSSPPAAPTVNTFTAAELAQYKIGILQ